MLSKLMHLNSSKRATRLTLGLIKEVQTNIKVAIMIISLRLQLLILKHYLKCGNNVEGRVSENPKITTSCPLFGPESNYVIFVSSYFSWL